MNPKKLTPVALALSMTAFSAAQAEEEATPTHSVSANIGVVSNYLLRGTSLSADEPAVQGGVDYAHKSGLYAGTWLSSLTTDDSANGDGASYELDLYAGYGGSINDDLSYDIGAIYYAYPDGRDLDYMELYGNLSFKWFTLGIAYTPWAETDVKAPFQDGDLYYSFGFEYGELPYGLGFGARVGYYDFRYDDIDYDTGRVDGAGAPILATASADYWHYGATLSKDAGAFGSFSLNWDQNSGDNDAGYDPDPKFWVGWVKEF